MQPGKIYFKTLKSSLVNGWLRSKVRNNQEDNLWGKSDHLPSKLGAKTALSVLKAKGVLDSLIKPF